MSHHVDRMEVERLDGPEGLAQFAAHGPDPDVTLRRLDASIEPLWHSARRALFVARVGRRVVGRVAAVVREGAPEVGLFGWLEADEDAVAKGLLEAAAAWLRVAGCRVIRGPLRLALGAELGALVDGFTPPPLPLAPADPPGTAARLEHVGFRVVRERHGYGWTASELPAPPYALRQAAVDAGVRYWPLDPAGKGVVETTTFLEVVNGASAGRWGVLPITLDEARARVRELLVFGDPRLVWLASVDGEPAGVAIGIPVVQAPPLSGTPPTSRAREALRLLREALRRRGVGRAHLTTLAVAPRFAGRGIEGQLLLRVWRAALDLGVESIEVGGVDEDDRALEQLLWRLGAHRLRRVAVYERAL